MAAAKRATQRAATRRTSSFIPSSIALRRRDSGIQKSMIRMGKWLTPSVVAVLLAFGLAGCRNNQNQAQDPAVSGDDPAAVNLANASNTTQTARSENPPPPPADQGSESAPSDQQYGNENGGDEYAGAPADYSDTAYDVAPDPPPALPDYDQPEAPGDDYLWTPGYWSYASEGYYWVPGAWVMAPYVDALWTPGYWGYSSGRYRWYHGYWGRHIGFYGGVNYGHGYDGRGYEGGYWRENAFYYNTAVSHVNDRVLRNVYNYRITNIYNNTRVSYNGGNGGLNYRPSTAEAAAHSERHVAPLPVQRTIAQTAMQNRAQFASANHGHPQMVAESRPVSDGRAAPAPRAEEYHPAAAPRPEAGTPASARGMRPAPGVGIRPEPGRPVPEMRTETRPEPAARPTPESRSAPESRPVPGARPAPQPQERPEARPAPQPYQRPQPPERPQGHPATEPRNQPPPEQRPEARPQPQARPQPESRPAPQPRPQPEARPAPEARPVPGSVARPRPEPQQQQPEPRPQPESRPQPQPESRPQPEARPAPESRPAPEARPVPPPKEEQRPAAPPKPEGRPDKKPEGAATIKQEVAA